MQLILDTDPGVDDAMAYFYAHACDELDLIALTTVFGNVTIADSTRNGLWLVEMSGSQAKVYEGVGAPLTIPPNGASSEVHGPHGFGLYEIEEPTGVAEVEDAADFLVRAARENPGELTLCAVGPLSNVARAVQKDPDFVSNLRQLVIMGGTLDAPGNVTPFAEANFWNDPHAANIVVNAPGGGEITIVGLDVTDRIEMTRGDLAKLEEAAPKTGGFLKEIGAFYIDFYERRSGRPCCSLHDPAAVIACHLPNLFDMELTALSVVTEGEEIGNLKRRSDGAGRLCNVCVGVDIGGVLSQYKDVTSSNP